MPRGPKSRRASTARSLGVVGAGAALLVLTGAPATGVAASSAAAKCSTAGLRYSYASYGATFAVKVLSLNARGVKCTAARSLAAVVARDLLDKRTVPARIQGLAVSVKRPCASCTPRYSATATGPGKRIALVIMGGA